MQLDAIARNLRLGKRWAGPEMVRDAVAASIAQADPILVGVAPQGELVAAMLASHYRVRFEEVRTARDIDVLEDRYLRRKREVGFAQLRDELQNPKVDALLFQRIHAAEDDPDRWIAVLNLLVTDDRRYWNRFHELSHRIAEPPQRLLPFRRQRVDDKNAVEALIDTIAGELGFHRRLFRPFVGAAAGGPLTFQTIKSIRDAFAPTASLLAVMNAVVALWPRPALAFVARMRGRVRDDRLDRALRVEMQGRNAPARQSGLYMIPNMRVPKASVVHAAIQYKQERSDYERLAIWDTSDGTRLPDLQALLSVTPVGAQVYCLVSM
jgi:hypothetical protein